MTSRYWILTINNPTEKFEDFQSDNLKVLVGQKEVGDNGTEHWQLYAEFGTPVRLGGVKRVFGNRCHAEKRRGTRGEALAYVTKKETRKSGDVDGGGPFYEGISAEQAESLIIGKKRGTSEALLEVKRKLDEGKHERVIADEDFGLWVRYYRAFERYRCLNTKPRNHSMSVIVIQGPTGTGKSRWALEQYDGAYWKQRSQWWDGYSGEKVVVLDEFYGWLPFDLLLRLCDRYPLLVESKGGQLQMVAEVVVITTNSIPRNWYNNVYFDSLVRRVTEWKVFNPEGKSSFNKYSDAEVVMKQL